MFNCFKRGDFETSEGIRGSGLILKSAFSMSGAISLLVLLMVAKLS